MLAVPWWLSAILSLIAKGVNQYLANRRAEEALRDLGAATQANDSRVEAERQEAVAMTAGDAAADGPDDPRDLRSDS